jgi:hypothetical protein
MKARLLFAVLTLCSVVALAGAAQIPKVKKSYTAIKGDGYTKKRLKEIIDPETIKLIALTRNSKGTPLTKTFTPDWDSDDLMKDLFFSDRLSVEWGMHATETIFAQYTIVTESGLFILSICGSVIDQQPMTAAILRGDGFGCRFNLKMKKKSPNNAINADK